VCEFYLNLEMPFFGFRKTKLYIARATKFHTPVAEHFINGVQQGRTLLKLVSCVTMVPLPWVRLSYLSRYDSILHRGIDRGPAIWLQVTNTMPAILKKSQNPMNS
jgi:hypothetical protein